MFFNTSDSAKTLTLLCFQSFFNRLLFYKTAQQRCYVLHKIVVLSPIFSTCRFGLPLLSWRCGHQDCSRVIEDARHPRGFITLPRPSLTLNWENDPNLTEDQWIRTMSLPRTALILSHHPEDSRARIIRTSPGSTPTPVRTPAAPPRKVRPTR